MEFVLNNISLIAMALVSGALLLWPSLGQRLSGINGVDVAGAIQLINHQDALVLDVREDREYAEGHISHARHIPLGQLATRLRELEKHKVRTIVVSCRSGHRSAGACRILRRNGFEHVYNLTGGMLAWQQASMPTEKK